MFARSPQAPYIVGMIKALPLLLLLGCGQEYNPTPIADGPNDPPADLEPPNVVQLSAAQHWESAYHNSVLRVNLYVDRSGSMWQELAAVGDAALALAEVLDQGGQWEITFYTAQQNYFRHVGPFNSLAQAADILDAPYLLPNDGGEAGLGAVFGRPHQPGTVHVVFSDEDDQSFTPYGGQFTVTGRYWTVSEFADTFNARTDQSLILVIPQTCAALAYPRYMEAAALTGALVVDLCTDWTPWLSSFSWPFADMRTRYPLDYDPITGSIRVKFDGVLTIRWEYDPTTNTITLASPPPLGTDIDITYNFWAIE